MFENLLGFAVVAGLLTMLPGIDTAQVLRAVAIGGRKQAYLTLFGIMSGVWFWGIAAALGLSALLIASQTAYTVVKWIGALYLIYLGVKMWIDSRTITHESINEKVESQKKNSKTFLRAFFITLTNPKNGVFYVAVLPQFMPDGIPVVLGGLLLSTIHNLLCLIWFSLMIFGAGFAKEALRNPRVAQRIERLSGLALIGFGIRVVFE